MSFFETEWERPEFESVPSLAENMVYLLRGCDNLFVRKTLQEVYRDFCRRSSALRTWHRIEIEDGEVAYPVSPLMSGEIDCVTQVVFASTMKKVDGWHVIGGEPPVVVLDFLRGHDLFVSEGDGKPSVLVETVEIPHMNEERAPRAFLRRYGDAIADGALARLYSMGNMPWADMEQARQRGIAYSNALSEARQRALNGGQAANAGKGFAIDLSGMV